MSTHVVGFKPADEKWHKMKAAWDACKAAGIPIPEPVEDFFNGEPPDPRGVSVDLDEHPAMREWSDDGSKGYEVDLKALPPDVTVLRFVNSW